LLNAGAGIHAIEVPGWEETSVDLFVSPLQRHRRSVCASVEEMPFADAEFDSVVCVGEVLGYCDPARAIREFARVLRPGGKLVCDYGSSGSPRQWGDMRFRRAAALFDDTYNGSPERIWIYAPSYIESLLKSCGFEIERRVGWHFWSSVLGRCGIKRALEVERSLRWLPLPSRWCDLVTTVSVRR
jgi:SAM-dependent methyltransferase